MLLFYSTQVVSVAQAAYFSVIYHHKSFQNPILNVASIAFTSQVHGSTILLLRTVGNKMAGCGCLK